VAGGELVTDPFLIEDMLFIDNDEHGVLRIECNWCSKDDYLFSESHMDTERGWFAKAVAHFKSYHPDRIKELTWL
jgi:hypothetical protein